MLMPNIALLRQKGEYLNVADMKAVFGVGQTTLWKYEKNCIDGFPRSAKICGKKLWVKKMVEDYIGACNRRAAETFRRVNELAQVNASTTPAMVL